MSTFADGGPAPGTSASGMFDPYGRHISYLRVSVTDRCDLRCVYCMSEHMTFLPKAELLTIEELDRLCSCFIRLGVKKLRLTGGEPLVRREVMTLIRSLSGHLATGALQELTLTTNGTQLARYADELARCGIRRINVSLDSLCPTVFGEVTRWGKLQLILNGLAAAKSAGLKVKINTVVMKGVNHHETNDLVAWCGENGFDIAFIEVMPMGEIGEEERLAQFYPLSMVRADLQKRWTLKPTDYRTGGPARYVDCVETGQRIGFITPLTHNFCESCNRVRVTCSGMLYMCLGQHDSADLRAPLRASEADQLLEQAILEAISRKPKGHDFTIDRRAVRGVADRHMSVTGG
jgi:cyclic pyranopterin phosphate synthase